MSERESYLLRRIDDLKQRVRDLERQLAEKQAEVNILMRQMMGAVNLRDE